MSTFLDFYKSLYSAENADATAIASHLNNVPLPTIAEEDRSSLDAALIPEVRAAIQSMPNGKCPGPDGFPLESFKKFLSEIHSFFYARHPWYFKRKASRSRYGTDNVHHALNVVQYLNTQNQVLIPSLDAKKAFDLNGLFCFWY